MKILKVCVGVLLLFGAAAEYVSASHELLSFTSPGVLIGSFLVVFLCAWLIGSGVSVEKLKIKSFKFMKYFAICFAIFSVLAFVNLATYKQVPDIIIVNNIAIDIAEMMDRSKKIIPDDEQRRFYCVCVVSKLANDTDISKKYSAELRSGKIDKIILELNAEGKLIPLNFDECVSSITEMSWTPGLEKSLKNDILKNLQKSKYAKSNDLVKFCDCQITEYKKLSAKELSSEEFANSQKKYEIEKECDLKSRLNK